MIWDDIGFLVSKNKYNENSLISEIFTENHGKTTGIIFGGTSKKMKNYLQVGNKLTVNYNSKLDTKIGYFKVEINQVLSPYYFNHKKKLSCIISAMSLIKILTADSQENKIIFRLIENFYSLLKTENWIQNYVFWELELFKNLGYDLDLKNFVEKKIVDGKVRYVSKSGSIEKIIPNFLIDKNEKTNDLLKLLDALKLVGDYLEKSILKPNSLTQPISRIDFLNSLK